MKKLLGPTSTKTVALIVVMTMCLFGVQAATASASGTGEQRVGVTDRTVAHTNKGDLKSRIIGTTGNGRKVTGSFVPLNFTRHDGKVLVRGLVQGVVHERNGERTTFAKLKTIRVKSINGAPVRTGSLGSARALATCDILHLVLAPLDLDLLGLQVHLDRVVLDIVAVTGAGKLLGNLLCAVTGLLDGGLGGLLGQLVDLLNQILGALRLG